MLPSTSQLDLFRTRHHLPGLVLSTFTKDSIDTLASGDVEESVPFPIASVTKTFTADLVLELADAHMLDRPLRDVLPDFALADPEASTRLTPRDALCHFSGLPPHTWAWIYGDLPRADFIRDRLPRLPSVGPFRERHRYSNLLYAVLGQWIESVSGQSWETRLQQVILDPLGLERTALLDETWATRCPVPYERCEEGIRSRLPFFAKKQHLIAPASEMSASVPDLAAWGRHHLRLSPEDPRWRPHNLIDTRRPHPAMGPLHYGLGWRVDTVCGIRRVWHSGQCGGYSSLLVLYPEQHTGFAAAANLHASVLPLQALDLWIQHDIDPEWPSPETLEVGGRRAEVGNTPTQPLNRPTTQLTPGLYTHPGYGDLELRVLNDKPHSRFQNTPPVPLHFAKGIPRLTLPGYSVSFPISQTAPGRIAIPFEEACEPTEFELKPG